MGFWLKSQYVKAIRSTDPAAAGAGRPVANASRAPRRSIVQRVFMAPPHRSDVWYRRERDDDAADPAWIQSRQPLEKDSGVSPAKSLK